MKRLEEIIKQKVRPKLNEHNGDIKLLEVTADGIVKVKLTGACSTCPGAHLTLSEIVEASLKEVCPEIKGVVPVHQVSDELIDSALAILRRDR
ncbi:MAG: nfuA [Firmicutes bacterium]|nr:nfuA [Bacillota bacterium]